MIINENKKDYNIIIVNNNEMIEFMKNYIIKYIAMKEDRIIGIDFEFNRVANSRKVALCQINMEINNNNNPYIFLFYPPDIEITLLIKLFTTSNIIRILHGGESLDVPYLFTEILVKNSDRIKFLDSLVDTRFMCEYYNNYNKLINNKCKIYELLKQMKVIDISKYNYLEKNDKLMGNIWEIDINVKKMSKNVVIYCLYDVIFLPTLYNCFPKNNIYNIILPKINGINMLLRYNYKLDKIFSDIAKYNNNLININNEQYSFNEIYNTVYYWLDSYHIIYSLLQINYLKKFFEIFIKNILYNILNKDYIKYEFNTLKEFEKYISPYIMEII